MHPNKYYENNIKVNPNYDDLYFISNVIKFEILKFN